MTDQELLALAAKAYGINVDKSPYNGGGYGNTGFDMNGNIVLDWHNGLKWNPLKNFQDAMQMAITLKLVVDCSDMPCIEVAYKIKKTDRHYSVWSEDGEDGDSNCLRAITHAAAEIGKNMK